MRLLEDANSTISEIYDCTHNDYMSDHEDDRCVLKKIKSITF